MRFFVCKTGAQGGTRTHKIWLLRPTRIPIPSPGLDYYNNTQRLLCQLIWYLDTVSNRGPSPCKGDALPLSYPGKNMERGKRIELSASAWKAEVLPLYEPRIN